VLVWVVEHELIELSGPQSINTGGLVAPYGVGLGRGSSSPIGWRSPFRPPTLRLPLPAVAGLATILLTVERGRVPLIPISAAVASAGPDTTLIRVHPVDGLVVFVLISVLLSHCRPTKGGTASPVKGAASDQSVADAPNVDDPVFAGEGELMT
jgi:hypothetical protein